MQDNQPPDKPSGRQLSRCDRVRKPQIRHNLKYLHSLQDHVDEYFFAAVSQEDWRFLWIMHDELEVFGYSAQELVSKSFLDSLSTEDAARVKATLSRSLREGDPQIAILERFRCKDGSRKYLSLSLMHMPEQGLSYVRWRNLSRRYEALGRAERAEDRYRTLFDKAADSMMLVDSQTGKILEFNTSAHSNLGYSRQEFRGLAIADFDVIDSPEQVTKRLEQIAMDGTMAFETKHRTKDGEVRNINVNSRMMDIEGRECVLSIFHDITKRKRAEEALRQSKELLRRIHDRLIVAQEQVRRNVARELHDGIGQELAALHMGLSGVLMEHTGKFAELDEQIEPSLKKALEICVSIIRDIRRICRGLYPAQLEDSGLVGALRDLAQQPSGNIKVQVDISESAEGYEFDDVSAISLYRIAQAAFLNAIKHSRANNLTLRLDQNEGGAMLTVTDDGIGFNPAEKLGKGMGLMSMHDWAHTAGGSLKIHSKPGQTGIEAVLPTEIVSSDPLPDGEQEQ